MPHGWSECAVYFLELVNKHISQLVSEVYSFESIY